MKKYDCFLVLVFALLLVPVLFFPACKTKPEPVEGPFPSLVFDRVEAEDPAHLRLYFTAEVENPFPSAGKVKIESWRIELNGKRAWSGFSLESPKDPVFNLAPGFNSFPLQMNMDIDALAAQGLAPADEYELNLIAKLVYSIGSSPQEEIEVSGIAVIPGVRAPVFSITSIAILKAELINTRFRVSLVIENPNPFPVELAAFSYELYGNGRLWADGMEKNIIRVKGKSSLKGDLYLIMNFINMKRDLLDQVIDLIDVNYRFAGEARVSTEVEYLPKFVTKFDLSGYSRVFEN